MYSLWWDPLFYLAGIGLVASAVMFGYFVRSWRKAGPAFVQVAGREGIDAGEETMPSGEMSKAAMFLKNVHDDILVFNNRLKSLEQTVSERNFSQERKTGEVVTSLNSIMDKLENLEPQIQQDLQPQLQSLGMAIESLRTSMGGSEAVSPESAVTEDAVAQEPVAAEEPTAVTEEPAAVTEEPAQEPAEERPPDEPPPDPLTGDSKSVYPV